jgi:3-hydroxy-9,10-secoandrosta-1,3,5(10)-triene-9,17-dione monooxygenase reductase component
MFDRTPDVRRVAVDSAGWAGDDCRLVSSCREPAAEVETLRFRDILGCFATGVVVIAALDPDNHQAVGLVANSFTSVSLDPALVAFCIAYTSTSWPRVRASGRYCVNILGHGQRHVVQQLAASGKDKFRNVGWSASPSGRPVLVGSLAWLECVVHAEYCAGDHVIVVSRVLNLDRSEGESPLVFFRGQYGRFSA